MHENKSQILLYQNENGETKLDVRFQEETAWLNQLQLSELFAKSKKTISEHINNIFKEGELLENSVVRKFRTTAQDGKLYNINFYNLDVIISVGYRVKSKEGTQFRIWAISNQTAAELVYRRVDSNLPLLGMQSYDKDNNTKIKKSEISTAKNYLNEDEMKLLGLIVEQYLAFAETMALQKTPMYMKDWISRLDIIVQLNGKELLTHAGKISHQKAVEKSNEEFAKYRETKKRIEREDNLKEIEKDISQLNIDIKKSDNKKK